MCDKSFNQKNNLTTHLRTHSDYHPSSCSTCKQNFSSFNELFNHMRQHVEEKPLICSICNKVLNCQSDLNEHMKSHSNKPYKCDVSNCLHFHENCSFLLIFRSVRSSLLSPITLRLISRLTFIRIPSNVPCARAHFRIRKSTKCTFVFIQLISPTSAHTARRSSFRAII